MRRSHILELRRSTSARCSSSPKNWSRLKANAVLKNKQRLLRRSTTLHKWQWHWHDRRLISFRASWCKTAATAVYAYYALQCMHTMQPAWEQPQLLNLNATRLQQPTYQKSNIIKNLNVTYQKSNIIKNLNATYLRRATQLQLNWPAGGEKFTRPPTKTQNPIYIAT